MKQQVHAYLIIMILISKNSIYMKTNLLLSVSLLISFAMFTLTFAQAQDQDVLRTKVGFRLGVLTSKQDFQNGDFNQNVKSKLGADIALVADFPVGHIVSISPEIHWLQKGAKIEDLTGTAGEIASTFNYLEVPVLFKLHFGDEAGFLLFAGPSAGYLLDGSDKDKDGNKNDIDLNFYKRTEFGLHVGGGIALGPLVIDIRYIFGLSNIFDSPNGVEVKNRSLGAGVSLLF
jgi:hypothetical protein